MIKNINKILDGIEKLGFFGKLSLIFGLFFESYFV